MTVRSFCNADLPHLVRLWNEHWSAIGPDPMIDMARLEQAILARTFFAPDALLVAESATADSTEIIGWCLYYSDPHCPSTTIVAALCANQRGDESVEVELLNEVEARSAEGATQNVCVGVIRDREFGLAGLSPVGFGIGMPTDGSRVNQVLEQLGYHMSQQAQRFTASVPSYRPIINRQAMQLRRSSRVETGKYFYSDPRSSAGLSHLDIETHRLVDRTGIELASLNLWFSDPEAEVMSPSTVILDLESIEAENQLSPEEFYLIGTAVQSLAGRGITTVETVLDPTAEAMLSQWRSLQFEGHDQGSRWQKQSVR